jgi:hypothetical protein
MINLRAAVLYLVTGFVVTISQIDSAAAAEARRERFGQLDDGTVVESVIPHQFTRHVRPNHHARRGAAIAGRAGP